MLRKEIDLSPFIKYLFVFLLGISASSYFLYKRINNTNSVPINHEQRSELKMSTHYPVLTYYFDVNKYDSITSVITESSEHKQDIYHRHIEMIQQHIYKSANKPELIEIHGYADETGKDSDNIILSRKRAEFVNSLFKDVNSQIQVKINVVNGGVIMDSCNNPDTTDRERCLASNRRVDVYFYGYLPAKRYFEEGNKQVK